MRKQTLPGEIGLALGSGWGGGGGGGGKVAFGDHVQGEAGFRLCAVFS